MKQIQRWQIVFPPQVDPGYLPYRAASLAKRLRLAGHIVQLVDDNLNAYDYFLTPRSIAAAVQQAEQALRESSEIGPGETELRYYRAVKTALCGPAFAERVARAWQKYLDADASLAAQARAKRIVQQGLEAASLATTPTLISLHDLNLRYSTQSTREIIAAASDPAENPYRAFFQARLSQVLQDQPESLLLWIEFDQQLIPAFTLARLLKDAHSPTRIILGGPFLQPFAPTWQSDGPWRTLIDEVISGNDALEALIAGGKGPAVKENTTGPNREEETGADKLWSVDGLPLARYPGQPATVVLTLDETEFLPGETVQTSAKVADLFRRMQTLAREATGLRFHIATPLEVPRLLELAALIEANGCAVAWGSFIAFGAALTSEQARALARAGCHYLHFEIKGYLGYPDPATARSTMVATWQHTRQAGMFVLWTIVYGHPLDDPAQFPDAVAFLAEHLHLADRLVRFKVFRLYRGSRFWRDPKAYGIRLLAAETNRDLQRHFAFVSRYGMESEHLHTRARGFIATLQKRLQDFPQPPLAMDDRAFSRPTWVQAEAGAAATISLDEQGLLMTSPSLTICRLHCSFSELDRRWSGFLPGFSPLPAEGTLAQSPSVVAYEAEHHRLLVVNGAVLALLELCREPVRQEVLFQRFPAKQHAALRSVLEKLIRDGLILSRDGEPVRPQPPRETHTSAARPAL
ncbi:MAG TPA: hypothetical protein VF458_04815 [Ktedonobacteraceae bacterium]